MLEWDLDKSPMSLRERLRANRVFSESQKEGLLAYGNSFSDSIRQRFETMGKLADFKVLQLDSENPTQTLQSPSNRPRRMFLAGGSILLASAALGVLGITLGSKDTSQVIEGAVPSRDLEKLLFPEESLIKGFTDNQVSSIPFTLPDGTPAMKTLYFYSDRRSLAIPPVSDSPDDRTTSNRLPLVTVGENSYIITRVRVMPVNSGFPPIPDFRIANRFFNRSTQQLALGSKDDGLFLMRIKNAQVTNTPQKIYSFKPDNYKDGGILEYPIGFKFESEEEGRIILPDGNLTGVISMKGFFDEYLTDTRRVAVQVVFVGREQPNFKKILIGIVPRI